MHRIKNRPSRVLNFGFVFFQKTVTSTEKGEGRGREGEGGKGIRRRGEGQGGIWRKGQTRGGVLGGGFFGLLFGVIRRQRHLLGFFFFHGP